MGRFIEGVQKDEVMGPLRQKFNRNKWNKAFDDLGNDEADVDLYHVEIVVRF